MSIKNISKVSRNSFIRDVVEASLSSVEVAKIDFDTLEATLIYNASEDTVEGWEKWFGLGNIGWSLEDRRARLIYTFNSRGFFTPKFLKEQASIFSKGEIEIEEQFENYHFVIQFKNYVGVPDNLDSFKQMVDINKPAHLTFEILFRYRTHKELKEFTHNHLSGYTHTELKELRNINGGVKNEHE